MLEELIGVMGRPKFHRVITSDIAQRLIEIIKSQAVITKPRRKVSLIKNDPVDNMFLAAALEGGADCVVTGDNHVLSVREDFSIPILTPAEFLKRLKG